jgi:hypothetical protein
MPEARAREEVAQAQPAEAKTPPAVEEQPSEVHLVYKLEGEPNEVDIFELSRVLAGLGEMVQESYRVVNQTPEAEVVMNVRPIREGSWWMDLVMTIQQSPGMLFFLAYPEAVKHIKDALEALGLIKKGVEAYNTVLDVIKFLRNGKPAKVEQTGPDEFKYENMQGEVLAPITTKVHTLVNNGTIQQNFYYVMGSPVERPGVEALKTFLPNHPETLVQTQKGDTAALKAYTMPELEEPQEEVVKNVTTEFLHPKAGTYGETSGTWTFRKAGTKRTLKAKISDEEFLSKFERGTIRFYQGDLLKVQLAETQKVKGTKASIENQIIAVLEYRKGPPAATANGRKK